MSKDVKICEGYNKADGYVGVFLDFTYGKSRRRCDFKASMFENGKWYCKKHAPSKIIEREAKANERYMDRIRKSLED